MANKQNRKHGRNSKSGQNMAYKAEHRREKGHVRRIEKHLTKFPNDHYAQQMLRQFRIAAGLVTTRAA